MEILALVVLFLVILGVITHPLVMGKERKPYGTESWICTLINAAILIPLCLRVLGII